MLGRSQTTVRVPSAFEVTDVHVGVEAAGSRPSGTVSTTWIDDDEVAYSEVWMLTVHVLVWLGLIESGETVFWSATSSEVTVISPEWV